MMNPCGCDQQADNQCRDTCAREFDEAERDAALAAFLATMIPTRLPKTTALDEKPVPSTMAAPTVEHSNHT